MDKKLLMMALLITTGLATHAQEKLTRYQVRNAITVRTPIMNDSINPKEKTHSQSIATNTGSTRPCQCTDSNDSCRYSRSGHLRES